MACTHREATHRHSHPRHSMPPQLSEVPKWSQLLACHLWALVVLPELPGNESPKPIPDVPSIPEVPSLTCLSGPALRSVMWFVFATPWSMLVLSPESPPAEKHICPLPIFSPSTSLLFIPKKDIVSVTGIRIMGNSCDTSLLNTCSAE